MAGRALLFRFTTLPQERQLWVGVLRVMAKKATKAQKKVASVMREFKAGTLNSGSSKGPKVKSRKQAIAIALSEGAKVGKRKGKKKA